ncbi:TetR/AcrR family transcriptional regulator [Solwaraspora sp. WMMD1047]|uniref:TetR/AcrR family transcriptional regulator n=1 Tax=Solwaraspora sp. WMMD1047 TaxID=3016102 RepID=UPI00241607E2|nr:TetR/AcrR family transcriptional regulator [Solwaraspora sp. WMMD1047]MDG4834008.1 TetR/AcrR family transcriptional regulator [Solwaraspora sp. WMMD1047]
MAARVRLSAEVRRAQIVDSAIGVIADDGFAAATFARIARRAGLSSTALISYHFTDKADLMRAIVGAVFAKAYDFIRPRMDAQSSPAAILHEFIVASVEFYAAHPQAIRALTAVRGNLRRADGRPEFGPEIHDPELAQLQEFMHQAQRAGEMATFDTRVAAVSLRAALDAAALEVSRPDRTDPARYARELARLFASATGQKAVKP